MNSETGKYIVIIGVIIMLVGIAVWFFHDRLHWTGRLPGDIRIERYQFSEEEHQVRYNQPQQAAIAFLINKMMEYGYAVSEIDKVSNSVLHSQNAYINKETLKLVRLINRLNHRGEHIGDETIKKFISLANQYKPEEKTEKAPLSEIIQIFA